MNHSFRSFLILAFLFITLTPNAFAVQQSNSLLHPEIISIPTTITEPGVSEDYIPSLLPTPVHVRNRNFIYFRGSTITRTKPKSIFFESLPEGFGVDVGVFSRNRESRRVSSALIQKTPTRPLKKASLINMKLKNIIAVVGIAVGIGLGVLVVNLLKKVLGGRFVSKRENRYFVIIVVTVMVLLSVSGHGPLKKKFDAANLYIDNATQSDFAIQINQKLSFDLPKLTHRLVAVPIGITKLKLISKDSRSNVAGIALQIDGDKPKSEGSFVFNIASRNEYTVKTEYYYSDK